MERVNESPIYWVGKSLGQLLGLLSVPLDIDRAYIINAVEMVRVNLEVFITLDEFPRSKKSAKKILNTISKSRFMNLGLKDFDPKNGINPLITSSEKKELANSIIDFQVVLNDEMAEVNIFFVNTHRAYNMRILIEQGENLLSPITLDLLGSSKPEVIKDIREAARSLAFDFSTAVGFHLYRAIEAIIVENYFPVLGVLPTDYEKNPNLGCYIKILEKNGIDNKITVLLAHIKDRYRNPINHPDEFWNIEDANNAIGSAISLIDMMIQDIDGRRKKTVSP
jgi:hypothetical protein